MPGGRAPRICQDLRRGRPWLGAFKPSPVTVQALGMDFIRLQTPWLLGTRGSGWLRPGWSGCHRLDGPGALGMGASPRVTEPHVRVGPG